MFNGGKQQNTKIEGGTIYKGKEEQRTLGTTPRQESWATSHLLPQRDVNDTSNLSALLEPVWHQTWSTFHNLLKHPLKGREKQLGTHTTVGTLDLVSVHTYYS